MKAWFFVVLFASLLLFGCAQSYAPSNASGASPSGAGPQTGLFVAPASASATPASTPLATPGASAAATPSASPAAAVSPLAPKRARLVTGFTDALARVNASSSVSDEFVSACQGSVSTGLAVTFHVTSEDSEWRATCKKGPAFDVFFSPDNWPLLPGATRLLVECSDNDAAYLSRALFIQAKPDFAVGLSNPLPPGTLDYYAVIGACRLKDGKVLNRFTYAIETDTGTVHT